MKGRNRNDQMGIERKKKKEKDEPSIDREKEQI